MTNKEIVEFINSKINTCEELKNANIKIDPVVKNVNDTLLDFYKTMQVEHKAFEILKKYVKINTDYSEQSSGSTQAIEIIVPNCITVEEDDQYVDDCYPNDDFEFLKELLN